jgi:hypothetical protein
VHVQVKHGLSRSRPNIENRPISVFDLALAGNLRRRNMALANDFSVAVLGFLQTGQMFFGDNENMCGRLRLDIFECEHVFVFVHFFHWNFAAEDAAKEAIGVLHG